MTTPRRDIAALVSVTSAGSVLTMLAVMPDWYADGLCAQTDPEAFFPEKGGSTRAAKAMCAICPVRDDCLEWAIANNERFGIWGGLSERQRRAVVRGRQVAAS